jgi:hypothetical protein
MNVVFDLPPAQAEKLREAADDAFREAAERVLRKNAELYRRLA